MGSPVPCPFWGHLSPVSRGLPWSPVISRGLPWSAVVSRGLLWSPVISRGLPWSPESSRSESNRIENPIEFASNSIGISLFMVQHRKGVICIFDCMWRWTSDLFFSRPVLRVGAGQGGTAGRIVRKAHYSRYINTCRKNA